jgi:hypothetical protein
MVQESTNSVPSWTFTGASRTLPYIRVLLRHLREGFITIWHLFKVAGYDAANPAYREQMRFLRDEGLAALEELDHLGVIAYQSPLRGIALFPFLVRYGKGGVSREAYFVFKDTRDGIDSFIFADELCEHNDLYGCEMLVPEAWKELDAIPVVEKEGRRGKRKRRKSSS